MGDEFIIVNLDKKEILDFDKLGLGAKIGAMTSEPIACILSWLLINPEGYVDAPAMFGRWVGDRIEIVGDEQEGSRDRRSRARKDFRDITFDAVVGFTATNSSGRVFKRMGLIDKNGSPVVNLAEREAVAKYWRALWDQQEYELQTYVEKWDYVDDVLRGGSPTQVQALRCPQTGGPMRIQYIHTKEAPPHFRLSTPEGRFLTSPFAPGRPPWVDVLGEDFVTEPGQAEQAASPNGRPAESSANSAASGGRPSVS